MNFTWVTNAHGPLHACNVYFNLFLRYGSRWAALLRQQHWLEFTKDFQTVERANAKTDKLIIRLKLHPSGTLGPVLLKYFHHNSPICKSYKTSGSYCCTVGGAVPYNTRDFLFESCHQQILFTINYIESVMKRQK